MPREAASTRGARCCRWRPIARTFADRVLAIGDAAGIVKATTGGGIYYSLVSAAAAAEVLAPALRRDALGARVLQAYEAAGARGLAPRSTRSCSCAGWRTG